ncbi:MAG: phosphoribosylglycinamide formyltransferase [Mobiluncus porci]|uniref:phosphoribosylglycinamide formyltransferase n=1 Tax=Mobiluncus porci TaxID=2652278 RepID=UPI0023F557FF|nr:phosphoribosylglycinamide formyltransferase [Mobiluncus porci]MDD7540706.1 phosphoribosylglycinamide formyltransferase [Mobiluncus porci]MDY5748269.1 phosphoribosylglycinamide formyltransferase [Mobiluncus porci]
MTKQTFTLPSNRPTRIVVLISGTGSNLQALAQATRNSDFRGEIVGVLSDRDTAEGITWSQNEGLDTAVVSLGDFSDRESWDAAMTETVNKWQPDLVVSAGFLKILGPRFLAAFPNHIVNTHNSLLPSFVGIHGPRDALRAGVKLAGATLFVVDPGMDTGPILAQTAVPVEDDDTVETLTERIKTAERAQLVESVGKMIVNGWWIDGVHAGF